MSRRRAHHVSGSWSVTASGVLVREIPDIDQRPPDVALDSSSRCCGSGPHIRSSLSASRPSGSLPSLRAAQRPRYRRANPPAHGRGRLPWPLPFPPCSESCNSQAWLVGGERRACCIQNVAGAGLLVSSAQCQHPRNLSIMRVTEFRRCALILQPAGPPAPAGQCARSICAFGHEHQGSPPSRRVTLQGDLLLAKTSAEERLNSED